MSLNWKEKNLEIDQQLEKGMWIDTFCVVACIAMAVILIGSIVWTEFH